MNNGMDAKCKCKVSKKQVLARLKGPFDVVPQLVYSKTIAKSDKKAFATLHKK